MTVVKSNYAPKENQFYETPEWATEALLRRITVGKKSVWEPAAGNHKIADVLKQHRAIVTTSDIARYQRRHDFIFDFLSNYVDDEMFDWIITNPPYGAGNRQAVKFAEMALQRADNVALLLTAKFDFGKTRTHLFRDNKRFYAKINLMDRLSFFNGKTGTEDHAWYVWVEHPTRPTIFYEGK